MGFAEPAELVLRRCFRGADADVICKGPAELVLRRCFGGAGADADAIWKGLVGFILPLLPTVWSERQADVIARRLDSLALEMGLAGEGEDRLG